MLPEPFVLRVVDKETLQSIHEQSIQLLARAGVIFDSEVMIRRFKRKGKKIDGKRVYFSEKEVAEALGVTPKSFTMVGRNGAADVRIGGKQDTTVKLDVLHIAHEKCNRILEKCEGMVLAGEIDQEIEAYFKWQPT